MRDRFLLSRCLNDHIDLLDMIGSFASKAAALALWWPKMELKYYSTTVDKII